MSYISALKHTKLCKTIICLVCMIMLLMTSCKDGNKGNTYNAGEEPESDLLPYGVTDTINGKKVSKECAIINNDFERLQYNIDQVASPSMLMTMKATYQHDLDSISLGLDALPTEERSIIDTQRKAIALAYSEKCKEYEVPAEGVIDNLRRCIDRVNKARRDLDIIRFMETRRGMLNNLDNIHLCVESKSTRISEVQSLAKQLKNDLEKKKKQFGIE